jgi:hypothetical protein
MDACCRDVDPAPSVMDVRWAKLRLRRMGGFINLIYVGTDWADRAEPGIVTHPLAPPSVPRWGWWLLQTVTVESKMVLTARLGMCRPIRGRQREVCLTNTSDKMWRWGVVWTAPAASHGVPS